jgi:hypothetical protein
LIEPGEIFVDHHPVFSNAKYEALDSGRGDGDVADHGPADCTERAAPPGA